MRELFSGLTAQQPIRAYLQQAYETGRVTHAYMLAGGLPDEAMQLAVRFAAGIIAGDDDAEFDEVMRQTHPDLHVFKPAGTGAYLVDQIREVTHDAELAPIRARRKVYIVAECNRLSGAPANAFLKTLEEPPETVICLLIASSEAAVLDTLRSRCEVLVLQTGAKTDDGDQRVFEMMWGLAQNCSSRELLDNAKFFVEIARESAESFSGQETQEFLEKYDDYLSQGAKKEIEQQGKREASAQERAALFEMLGIAQNWLRDCLVAHEGVQSACNYPAQAGQTAAIGAATPLEGLLCAIDAVTSARSRISYNVTPQLAIEAMFLEIREALCRR